MGRLEGDRRGGGGGNCGQYVKYVGKNRKKEGRKEGRQAGRQVGSIVMASLTNVVLKGPEPMALHVLGRHSLPS